MARGTGRVTEPREESRDRRASIRDVLARNTRAWREHKNLTQQQVAKACGGWDHTEISRIERGRNVEVETLETLARALGVTESDLLCRKKWRPPKGE